MSLEGGDGGALSSRGKQAAVLQPRKGGVPAERNNEGKAQWTRSCRSEGRMGGDTGYSASFSPYGSCYARFGSQAG